MSVMKPGDPEYERLKELMTDSLPTEDSIKKAADELLVDSRKLREVFEMDRNPVDELRLSEAKKLDDMRKYRIGEYPSPFAPIFDRVAGVDLAAKEPVVHSKWREELAAMSSDLMSKSRIGSTVELMSKPKMEVYQAIKNVMASMSVEGISKDRNNAAQGYKFRGIDDVLNALSSVLVEHSLIIIPRVTERVVQEATTKSGGRMAYVTVQVEYDIISSEDGSKHTAVVMGEAMDSADKATNKAMSAAYKYMAIQTFCIPTEGDNDADASTPEVKPISKAKGSASAKEAPAPRPVPNDDMKKAGMVVKTLGLNPEQFKWLKAQFMKDEWVEAVLHAASKGAKNATELLKMATDLPEEEEAPATDAPVVPDEAA